MRENDAPSAMRVVISRFRFVARAMRRPATLPQAMSKTRPAPRSKSGSAARLPERWWPEYSIDEIRGPFGLQFIPKF